MFNMLTISVYHVNICVLALIHTVHTADDGGDVISLELALIVLV